MALINCSECGKEVSDKAVSCPNCGNPIREVVQPVEEAKSQKKEEIQKLEFPKLPEDLDIGQVIIDWAGEGRPGFKGICIQEGQLSERTPVDENMPSGKVTVNLHTHGIDIKRSLLAEYPIHNSQIINLIHTSTTELTKKNKSVIGRSIAGGLLLGPLGAVVGGISGTGYKEELKDKHYLVIDYWDINTKAPTTLIILAEDERINVFMKRQKEEEALNKSGRRESEENKPIEPAMVFFWIALLILVIVILINI